jgi:hypothetical protein
MIPAPTRELRPVLLVLLLMSLIVPGCSAPTETGRYSLTLITQQQHTVEDGQTLVGDTVVAGGGLLLQQGAKHRGSVTVLAGEARIGGLVVGDLMVLGGTADLTGTAEITGNVTAAGGRLTRAPGAAVRGSVTQEPDPASVLQRSRDPRAPVEWALWSLLTVAVMAGLGWLVARIAPRPMRRTAAAATEFPVVSGALGALILISALPLVASMIFSLFLIPVAGLVLLGLGVTAVHGLLAIGHALGHRAARLSGRTWSTPRAAALGTALVVAGLQLIGLVPFVGVAITGTVLVVSVGAALLTRFGLRPYTSPDDDIDDTGASDTRSRR